MRGAVLHGPRDIRVENRPDPTIIEPTDAIIRLSATCVCGSDLWPYRGINQVTEPSPIGHEYCGVATRLSRREERRFTSLGMSVQSDTFEVSARTKLASALNSMKPRQGMPWLRGEASGLPGR